MLWPKTFQGESTQRCVWQRWAVLLALTTQQAMERGMPGNLDVRSWNFRRAPRYPPPVATSRWRASRPESPKALHAKRSARWCTMPKNGKHASAANEMRTFTMLHVWQTAQENLVIHAWKSSSSEAVDCALHLSIRLGGNWHIWTA